MTATHAPDCDGEDAPWCSTACVAANRLVDVATAAAALGCSPYAVRGMVRRGRLEVAARVRRDRGRPGLRFRLADLAALATRDTPKGVGA